MRRLASIAASASLCVATVALAEDQQENRSFSAEEIKILKHVTSNDKMLKQLFTTQKVLSSFNHILAVAAPGPLKIGFKWNQVTFEGWSTVNSGLKAISDAQTCNELLYPGIDGSPNADFFEDLRKIRRCDE